MLFDPNSMPKLKSKRQKIMMQKRSESKQKYVGSFDSLHTDSTDMRQKPISKHKQPSIYVDVKVEKRKS